MSRQQPGQPSLTQLSRDLAFCLLLGALIAGATGCGQSPDATGREPAPQPKVDVGALRARAESGDPAAQAQLGRLYIQGEQVTNDFNEAAKWLSKAAAQANAEGQFGLGELHEAGRGVPRDQAEAVKLYRRAAEQGHSRAEYTLGFLYEAGRGGLPMDQKEATKWFLRAAEHGEALAQYDLGQRYDIGVGVKVDKVEALKWLLLAAAQGQPDAAERLKQVKRGLTREQIAEAERRASAFSKKTTTP